jgi:hypothetical protein
MFSIKGCRRFFFLNYFFFPFLSPLETGFTSFPPNSPLTHLHPTIAEHPALRSSNHSYNSDTMPNARAISELPKLLPKSLTLKVATARFAETLENVNI